jgi:hypothetical protein
MLSMRSIPIGWLAADAPAAGERGLEEGRQAAANALPFPSRQGTSRVASRVASE